MFNFSVYDAAAACCGRICGTAPQGDLGRIVIDSRTVSSGDVFAALKGENTDGHNYISKAFDNGAACCVAERIPENVSGCVILVDSVEQAIMDIAAAFRKTLHIPVIGITGSVGKTTAKEMVWAVLSEHFSVHKNEGNFNNTIGVPMTLSGIGPDDKAAVVEMGINSFGEMSKLAAMVRPDIALYTIIGHAHLEFLNDLDGVLRAKGEMIGYMSNDATVIVNGDDEKLSAWQIPQNKMSFGLGEGCMVRAMNVENGSSGTKCDIAYGERLIHAVIPAYGKQMVYAALEGATAGFLLGLSDDEIARGIGKYHTVGRRSDITLNKGITIVDDSYNSNPDSLRCAIDSLMQLPGRHVCILGDMLELGEESDAMHRSLGEYARTSGMDALYATGEKGAFFCEGFGAGARWFESKQDLIRCITSELGSGDCILIKSSRNMKFYEISGALKEL